MAGNVRERFSYGAVGRGRGALRRASKAVRQTSNSPIHTGGGDSKGKRFNSSWADRGGSRQQRAEGYATQHVVVTLQLMLRAGQAFPYPRSSLAAEHPKFTKHAWTIQNPTCVSAQPRLCPSTRHASARDPETAVAAAKALYCCVAEQGYSPLILHSAPWHPMKAESSLAFRKVAEIPSASFTFPSLRKVSTRRVVPAIPGYPKRRCAITSEAQGPSIDIIYFPHSSQNPILPLQQDGRDQATRNKKHLPIFMNFATMLTPGFPSLSRVAFLIRAGPSHERATSVSHQTDKIRAQIVDLVRASHPLMEGPPYSLVDHFSSSYECRICSCVRSFVFGLFSIFYFSLAVVVDRQVLGNRCQPMLVANQNYNQPEGATSFPTQLESILMPFLVSSHYNDVSRVVHFRPERMKCANKLLLTASNVLIHFQTMVSVPPRLKGAFPFWLALKGRLPFGMVSPQLPTNRAGWQLTATCLPGSRHVRTLLTTSYLTANSSRIRNGLHSTALFRSRNFGATWILKTQPETSRLANIAATPQQSMKQTLQQVNTLKGSELQISIMCELQNPLLKSSNWTKEDPLKRTLNSWPVCGDVNARKLNFFVVTFLPCDLYQLHTLFPSWYHIPQY
ncbi:uncharacterized protein BDR25DRAFT_352220 [Lindgomyces ingoldianus]|uniref:Uncharacterized protein n=1 Tax=Lindgomyces ingoldianus TaxID=673940 RepID=A0ACB6R362_9PLEO|nr:uncharacterized protein BDR25DRAFT_352220 [Lindgomyces ingoldianus]KAF2473718.1 hypothetical protein BDR25DRAFT_352220 [Lindgomyces ingoldianus]